MVVDVEKNKKLRILSIIGYVIMCIGIFLPFVKLSYFGTSRTINFIFNNGKVADGIFIIIFSVIAVLCIMFKKKIVPLILAGLSLAVSIYDISNTSNTFANGYTNVSLNYGIGCYLIFIGGIISIVSLIMLKKESKNVVQYQQVNQYTQNTSTENVKFCPNCGNKEYSNSAFCSNCGTSLK